MSSKTEKSVMQRLSDSCGGLPEHSKSLPVFRRHLGRIPKPERPLPTLKRPLPIGRSISRDCVSLSLSFCFGFICAETFEISGECVAQSQKQSGESFGSPEGFLTLS